MSDTMEIIISAVDSASEVFQSIISSATDMASNIVDSVDSAGNEFDNIADNVSNFSDAVANVDSSTLEELASELGMDTEEVERLLAAGADIGSLSAGFNEVAEAADELEKEIQEDADAMEEFGSAGDVMAANTLSDMAKGVASSMAEMADKAGTVQDSFTRMGLAAEGAGIPIDTMKSAVSDLSNETGRAGGVIRESFITMTSAGITDMNTMQTVFKGASAQAFILGTDVNALADKFSGMAMKSKVAEKTLKGTGITVDELGQALGMQGATIDEINAKWETLSTDQRAAALGMAASMNEGKDANDEYKNSWEGLQAQVDIAKGKLMTMAGNVLLPVFVPAMQIASDVLGGLGSVIDGVMKGPLGGLVSVLGASAGVFAIAVTGALALKNILGFLKIEAMLTKVETIALAFAEQLQAGGSIASAAANAIGATGFSGLAAAAWAAATAVWAAMAPLLPYIAAIALVAVAIYEVGKAFGWWTDVSSMIDAIKDGVMRLWDAFMNHPDVKATIKFLSDAWNTLSGAVAGAWQAVLNFFNINSNNKFDAVRAIIDGIGMAWQAMTAPIRLVISALQILYPYFMEFYNSCLVPLGEFLSGVFAEAWTFVAELLEQIAPFVQELTNAWSDFQSGQLDLPGLIMSVMTSLWEIYVTIVMSIVTLVFDFASQLLSSALQAGSNFLNGIVTYISQLPGRFLNYLNSVKLQIMAQMAAWVLLAKTKASELINGIISFLSQLPGKVLSTLVGVVSSIASAGSQWVSTARSKASELVSGAVSTLSSLPGKVASALSGVVDAIVKPFRDAYDQAKKYWDDITSLGGAAGGEVITAAAGETVDVITGRPFNIITGTYTNEPSKIEVEVNERIILDFANVPAHIDTDTLAKAIQDRDVLKALTTNRTFQDLDANIKSKIEARNNRSRGV